MKGIFVNESSNLINYNLSYKFLNKNIGIDVKETYPLRNSFYISDVNNDNYVLFKIHSKEIEKYKVIFEILRKIDKNGAYVSKVYSKDGQEIFRDEDEDYIIFKLPKGNYRKWIELDFNLIKEGLIKFYNSSDGILNDLYSFNLKEDMKLLTIGDEIKTLDIYLDIIETIDKIMFYKSNVELLDKIFIENKECMKEELLEAREFFSSDEFKYYCEDSKNIRFINGNLSNRSFLFDEKECFIANFYDSSIDLFVKDIAILVGNGMFYVSNEDLSLFIKNLLKRFNYNDGFHLEVIINYLKIYNYIFKWFNEHYIQGESCKNIIIEDKIKEMDYYRQKQYSFIKEYL